MSTGGGGRPDARLVLLVAASGVLLAPLGYLAALSGVCLRSPVLVETVTLGFLDYGFCGFLHLTLLPLLAVAAGIVHAVASAELLYRRISGDRAGRIVGEAFRAAVYILAAQLLALVLVWYTL